MSKLFNAHVSLGFRPQFDKVVEDKASVMYRKMKTAAEKAESKADDWLAQLPADAENQKNWQSRLGFIKRAKSLASNWLWAGPYTAIDDNVPLVKPPTHQVWGMRELPIKDSNETEKIPLGFGETLKAELKNRYTNRGWLLFEQPPNATTDDVFKAYQRVQNKKWDFHPGKTKPSSATLDTPSQKASFLRHLQTLQPVDIYADQEKRLIAQTRNPDQRMLAKQSHDKAVYNIHTLFRRATGQSQPVPKWLANLQATSPDATTTDLPSEAVNQSLKQSKVLAEKT